MHGITTMNSPCIYDCMLIQNEKAAGNKSRNETALYSQQNG
jgi:hypothetical protein